MIMFPSHFNDSKTLPACVWRLPYFCDGSDEPS